MNLTTQSRLFLYTSLGCIVFLRHCLQQRPRCQLSPREREHAFLFHLSMETPEWHSEETVMEREMLFPNIYLDLNPDNARSAMRSGLILELKLDGKVGDEVATKRFLSWGVFVWMKSEESSREFKQRALPLQGV